LNPSGDQVTTKEEEILGKENILLINQEMMENVMNVENMDI